MSCTTLLEPVAGKFVQAPTGYQQEPTGYQQAPTGYQPMYVLMVVGQRDINV